MVCLFGIQHSGLSSRKVKNKIIDNWGKQGYSRLYTVTSVLTLGLAFLTIPLEIWLYPLTTLPSIFSPLFLTGGVLVAIGGIIAYLASKVIDVSTVADMRTDRKPELITTGIYSKIRHPLYLGVILSFTGLLLIYLYVETLILFVGLIGYTLIGATFEENKLIDQYQDEYLEYKQKTGFVFPKHKR